jgi:hypothetical protein
MAAVGMTGVLLLLVLLAAGAAALVWYLRRRSQASAPPPPRVDPFGADEGRVDPRQIKVGDIVAIAGSDFVVRGTLRFDQSGFLWQEHFIDDVHNRRWLSVEDDEGLELCLWERHAPGVGEPGPPEMAVDGVAYRLMEHGTAAFTSEGTTGVAPSGRAEYFDYEAGDRRLTFERFGTDSWEVSTGTVLGVRDVQVFPTTG